MYLKYKKGLGNKKKNMKISNKAWTDISLKRRHKWQLGKETYSDQ